MHNLKSMLSKLLAGSIRSHLHLCTVWLANFSSLGIVIGGLCEYQFKTLDFSANNVLYDFLSPLFSITNFITYHLLICFFYYYYSIASICPPKKSVISTLVLRALFTGTCVSLINACVAGKQSVIIKIWLNFLPTPQLHHHTPLG